MSELSDRIRNERAAGDLLGPLTDKYGAAAVVEALGIHHIAGSLGITPDPADEPSPNWCPKCGEPREVCEAYGQCDAT